jgi:hypothetical protein
MESNLNETCQNISNTNTSYNIQSDWKFVSIVQFVNVFKNVVALDAFSSQDLEVINKFLHF